MTHHPPETEQATAAPADPAEEPPGLRRPAAAPEITDATRSLLRALAAFHRGEPSGTETLTAPGDDLLPALLHPFRDTRRVRTDYPLFLFPADATESDRLCTPLSELLRETLGALGAGADDARILRDNLDRLECEARDVLAGDAPVDAAGVLAEAGTAMIDALDLRPAGAEALRGDLDRLIEALPARGQLIGLGVETPLHLFTVAARHRARARRTALLQAVRGARATLGDLLRLDRAKEPPAGAPDAVRGGVGTAGAAHLDEHMLAKVLGSVRGTTSMDPVVRQIVEESFAVIEEFLAVAEPPLVTVVCTAASAGAAVDDEVSWRRVADESVCRAAAGAFDAQAADYAALFAAIRITRLLGQGLADVDRLAPLRAAFDWHSFSRDELAALPPILVLESAAHLAGAGMAECSQLLRSGRPVEVIVTVTPATDPGGNDTTGGYRFELAYLGISHREALVHQSSAARPAHLVAGFLRSLDATTGSLHVITGGVDGDGAEPRLGAWLHAGAALDSRAHPFIHYDPEAGATWARRFDLADNPQPDADWPAYELPYHDEAGHAQTDSVAFTFADFMLLEPAWRDHFRVIPPTIPDAELTPLADHLEHGLEASETLPFLWAAGADGTIHRLLVDRELVRACRDRRGYWRTLQELAGIRNEHVREAADRERERLETAFATEREQLANEHAETVEAVRREEARTVLERLARSLLDVDATTLAEGALTTPAPNAPAVTDAVAVAGADADAGAGADTDTDTDTDAVAAAPEDVAEEPWINSALCTSCNDCLDINPRLFVYNANKQAIIGNPEAGTYAQLVQAAEKCPARCIHPGLPLAPDEPGLEALIERARPFNG